MAGLRPIDPLRAALADLLAWLAAARVKGVVIGGVAASVLGRPRLTRDVDALVWISEDAWEDFLGRSGAHGFEPRIADPLAFARRSRVMLLRHVRSTIDADIVLGALPFEREAVERAVRHDLAGLSLPLPTPEDLVIMKAVAHRPRDIADVEGIVAAQPRLDRKRVRRWVRSFAEALEAPEIVEDLEALLRRARAPRKKRPS